MFKVDNILTMNCGKSVTQKIQNLLQTDSP